MSKKRILKDSENKTRREENKFKNMNSLDFNSTTKQKVFSIVLIVLMFFSTIAFIMLFSTDTTSHSYEDIPFQMFEQNGVNFYGTIKNSEQFIFEEIDSFLNKIYLEDIADRILEEEKVNLVINTNTSEEVLFLVEKALKGNRIEFERYFREDYISNNNLNLVFRETNLSNSLVLNLKDYDEAEALSYYLVR